MSDKEIETLKRELAIATFELAVVRKDRDRAWYWYGVYHAEWRTGSLTASQGETK